MSHRSVRSVAVAGLCLAGTAIYIAVVGARYPVKDWLFWSLLTLWSWCALLNAAWLSFGHLVVARWLRLDGLPTLEKLVMSAAVGLVGFTMAMYAAGAVGLFRPAFAVALPVAMILAGARPLWQLARRTLASHASAPVRPSWPGGAAVAAGAVCVVLLYLQCLTPEALNYDSRWYHLTVAQDYARAGRIIPFLADYNKGFPHLTSIVHTWGWLLPGLTDPLRWMLALQTEFTIMLWTLAGVGAAIAWFVGRTHIRGAWAAYFLFPGIFVYDYNIGGSADHFLGFFALPLVLAAVHAVDLSPRRSVLIGIVAAGAVLTKFQAIYLIVPVALFLGIRWLRLEIRRLSEGECSRRRRLWQGPVLVLGVGLLCTLPHFLKNWFFYGNPMYPFLVDLFPGTHPRQPDSAFLVTNLLSDDPMKPKGTLLVRVVDALGLAFTYSFQPHSPFAKNFPVLGSLYTLLLPVIPFLRRRRLWIGALIGFGAILTWASIYIVDRYTQAFIPILAAVAGATILCAWELGILARAGLVVLVGMQIVWGGDAPFYSAFERIVDSMDMIRSGYEGKAETRFDKYLRSQVELSKKLPAHAVVLFHNSRLSLGVNRTVLQDLPGFQGLISYRDVKTLRQLCQLYQSLGITHIVHQRGVWPAYSKQEEVVFAALLTRHPESALRVGEYEVIEVPSELPADELPYRVLSLGMSGYGDGVYPVETMGTYDPLPDRLKSYAAPATPATAESAGSSDVIDHVDAVLVGTSTTLPVPLQAALQSQFLRVLSFSGRFSVYVRQRPRAPG
jgi:hypothetical protein